MDGMYLISEEKTRIPEEVLVLFSSLGKIRCVGQSDWTNNGQENN